jgi:hypothetical protein
MSLHWDTLSDDHALEAARREADLRPLPRNPRVTRHSHPSPRPSRDAA